MQVKSKILPIIKEQDKNNFWSKVALTCNPNKCWNWIAGKEKDGYGRLNIRVNPIEQQGRRQLKVIASRLSYFINFGIDPVGFAVLHKCDNPSCVNPNHLFLGTNKDNTSDMIEKGRSHDRKGSKNGMNKLNDDQIKNILKEYSTGQFTQKEIGKKYGVVQQTIERIVNKKLWKHLN